MNTDKAYLLGLIIGGGVWGNAEDAFRIRLPYRQWGSISRNPERAVQIQQDIMRVVSPLFRVTYGNGLSISFDASDREWNILCEGDLTEIRNDLSLYGINPTGDMRQNAGISQVVPALIDDNLKRRFIAGLADTIGSTAPSHRRFSDEIQILSFEITGFNFSFVCDLCRLLYSVNCLPDQILWNHPNFHASNNPYYRQWTKGFKLRVQLDQYAGYGAFAFRSRAESARENLGRQHQTHEATPCPDRDISVSPTCVHNAEHDIRLPECIRGGHYLHNRHVCAVLGCEHAPYNKISALFKNAGEYINPFPILYKATLNEVEHVIANDAIMANRNYSIDSVSVSSLFTRFQSDTATLMYAHSTESGYPLTEIMQAIAYIVADNNELNGVRPRGNFLDLIARHLKNSPNITVEIRRPDLLTPLAVFGNGRGALIGAHNPSVYSQLISISPDNQYKLCVRQITEEDLRNA
jgi:hypothetical protein